MLSAFSVSREDIDHVLRLGGDGGEGRMRVAAEYMKGKSPEEIARFLSREYRGGLGLLTEAGRLSVWFDDEGIRLNTGDRARETESGRIISWEDAAVRIGELLDTGNFAANVELEETPRNAHRQAAESLWYLRQEFSDEASGLNLFPSLEEYRGGFPEDTERLTDALADPEVLASVTRDMENFVRVYDENRDVLRFHYC